MPESKENSIKEQAAEWLASCGFIFPSDEKEMERFRILHGPIDPLITGQEIDPFSIIQRSEDVAKKVDRFKIAPIKPLYGQEANQMVARKKNPFKKGK